MNSQPIVVAYGAGTNSTGMLVGMHERGERPDLILFSNTGDERPEIYKHIEVVNEWLRTIGYPEIITIVKGGRAETLEENCLRMGMLPSIAYGWKSCSQKFKREPQDKYCNNWPPARLAWECGLKLVKLLGYDADEERRAKPRVDPKYDYRYPLIEWDWDREACVAAIARAGLPQPGKSACFHCPSSKRHEIDQLKTEHPLLFQRALAMERNAEPNLGTMGGLGRYFSWHEHDDAPGSREFAERAKERVRAGRAPKPDERQTELSLEMPCDCYDGD